MDWCNGVSVTNCSQDCQISRHYFVKFGEIMVCSSWQKYKNDEAQKMNLLFCLAHSPKSLKGQPQ